MDRLDFSEYQKRARMTADYPQQYKIFYPAMGLGAEVGELQNKIKKLMRGDAFVKGMDKEDLASEMGDILWYVAILSEDLGLDLEEVAVKNIAKLADRKKRGVIKSSGDNR
jgi:NTP pyrophosphatase (non-canonical NTP hydrolase)